MTSQKSQNKITMFSLLKEDLRHRRWMLILSSFVQLMFGPIAVLFVFSDIEASYYYDYGVGAAQNARKAMEYAVGRLTGGYFPIMMMIIAIVGALIVGIGGYRHLFSRKMTDMVNSVPITRGKQFDSIYINNWLIWFVPQLVSTIISTIIILIKVSSYGYAGLALKSAVFVIIGSAVTFGCILNLVVLAVVLSGTVFNAILNAAFIGFDIIVAYELLEVLSQRFFDTFYQLPISLSDFSWVSAPISGGYMGVLISALPTDTGLSTIISGFDSVSSFCVVLGLTILVAIVNVTLAYTLYIKRKSEESESGVSNKAYRLFIRCFNSVLGGLIIASILDELFYDYRRTLNVWQMFFAAVFCAIIFGLIDMIHMRSFKGFLVHWKQMIAAVVVTELIFVTFMYDLTGFDTRIIPASSLKNPKAVLYIYGMGSSGTEYHVDPENEGVLIWEYQNGNTIDISPELAYRIQTAQREVWEGDADYILDPVTGTKTQLSGSMNDHYSVGITLLAERRSGLGFSRDYSIWDEDVVEEIINLPGFMEQAYPLRSGVLGYPRSIRIKKSYGYETVEIPSEYVEMIFDRTVEDFKENYSVEYLSMCDSQYAYGLELEYESVNPYSNRNDHYVNSVTMYLSEKDIRTIELLDELGYEEYRWENNDYYEEYYEYY